MKRILLVTALYMSGLFASLHGESNFAALGFTDKFTNDTLNALDAAFILDQYSKFNDNQAALDAIEDKEWFSVPSMKENRAERRKIVESIKEYGPAALRKMAGIDSNIPKLRIQLNNNNFNQWVQNFADKYDERAQKNREQMRNYLVEKINFADSLQAIKDDIEAQKRIIEDYKNNYSEVLKILGCSGERCDPQPPKMKKEL